MDLNELEKMIWEDPFLARLAEITTSAKVPVFLVGGYLRDLCLQIPRKDYDFIFPVQHMRIYLGNNQFYVRLHTPG